MVVSLSAGQEKTAGVDALKQTYNPRGRMKFLHLASEALTRAIVLNKRENFRPSMEWSVRRVGCAGTVGMRFLMTKQSSLQFATCQPIKRMACNMQVMRLRFRQNLQ